VLPVIVSISLDVISMLPDISMSLDVIGMLHDIVSILSGIIVT
jgi:hypothetical protein